MVIHKKVDYRQSPEDREFLVKQLKSLKEGAVVLHTCNRVEYYGGTGGVAEDTARHLFRLVSGLESIFIGETFIQGQVKEAYQEAASQWKLDASLHRLFQWALLTGKRVRTETNLSRGAMSHSQAVVEIIKAKVPDYTSKRFAFIGVNKINKTIMNFLKGNINSSFVLCNRTFEKALELEKHYNCNAFKLDHLKSALLQTDIVISATSAPHTIIKPEHIPSEHPLIIFDLAVPQDVDEEVQKLTGVDYYGLQKIEQQVNNNIAGREDEVIKASLIIEDEIIRFMEYQNKYYNRVVLKNEEHKQYQHS